jgi:hypothetical protein
MRHVQLWKAIREQATAWAVTPAFQRFATQLPRNARQRITGLPGLLQHLEAAGGGVGSRPLRLASNIPRMLDVIPGLDLGSLGMTWTSWLNDAQRVESAHRDTVAWIRSRLPGYPLLPAPQLAPRTPLTTVEFTWRLIWTPGERSRGLQFQRAPVQAAPALQATETQLRRLDESARLVAAAFGQTDEWARLAAAAEALDGAGRAGLLTVRAILRQRLAAVAVTAHEPNLAMRRDAYRQVVLSEEIETLSGSAREYADAFEAADQLVETAASDIFGQLAAYGEPTTFTHVQDIDLLPRHPQAVTFILADDVWPEIGSIAWVDNLLVPDAVHITAITVHINEATGDAHRVTGTVLTGTATAWQQTGRET